MAAERGVDLASIVGTGADGMVTEDDVKRYRGQASRRLGTDRAGIGLDLDSEWWTAGTVAARKLTRIQAVGARNLDRELERDSAFSCRCCAPI